MDFDFALAEQMLPENLAKLADNLNVRAHFFGDSSFWYRKDVHFTREFEDELGNPTNEETQGKEYIRVDIKTNTVAPAFHHQRLAASLAKRLHTTVHPYLLPFDEFEYSDDGTTVLFTVDGIRYTASLDTYQVTRVRNYRPAAEHEVVSPDGQWAAYLRGNNLAVRSLATGEVRLLTRDGKKDCGYGIRPDFYGTKTVDDLQHKKQRPMVLWSPDSSRIVTHRLDQRRVPLRPVMQYVPDGEYTPAKVHFVHYPVAGTEPLPMVEHVVLSLDGKRTDLHQNPLEIRNTDSLLSPYWQNLWWAEDGDSVYYIHPTRGYRSMQLFEANAATGAVRLVYEEKSDSFMDLDMRQNKENIVPDVRVLKSKNAFVWSSQRDGYYHLYLHSLKDGEMIRALTKGEWVVREIVDVDEEGDTIYFLGAGKESGRDPYYQHLYKVGLDGGEPTLLTPEDAEHYVQMSPSKEFFLDTFSRVNTAPVTHLRKTDGSLVQTIEEADISRALKAGYVLPEPFTVKAADGQTDLYGILVRPLHFDGTKKYPLVEYEYGAPQVFITPKSFSFVRPWGQSLAQLGFAVMIMDGRGTPGRSKAFHDFSAEALGRGAGLVDHAAAIPQLALKYPWLNTSRVGIHGFSGGGYGSARAIMSYPETYKVAVASCGDHDNRMYDSTWWERYMGLGDFGRFEEQDNQSLVGNLVGHLLLMHGDVDDNVHPNLTMRMVDALIAADKEFDMLLIPNRGHPLAREKYVAHRTWAYFLRNL